MMRVAWIGLIATMLLGVHVVAQKPQTVETLLQTAIKKEVVDGDLKGAIELYKKAAESSNRAIAVQALLHMAECYQTLNDPESRKVYERLVREFGDQPSAVATAKARLGNPLVSMARTPVHRVIEGRGGVVSVDGRYVFSSGSVGRMTDTLTQTSFDLYRPGVGTEPQRNLGVMPDAAFSPDSRRIAYVLADDFPPAAATVELRIAQLSDRKGPGELLFRNQDITGIAPFGWSPDARHVFALLTRRDETNAIGRISVASGDYRIIKSLDWKWPNRLSLSPNGQYIAYDAPVERNSKDRDIYLLSVNATTETIVVQNPARDAAPLWTPDGRALAFSSDRPAANPDFTRTRGAGTWVIEVVDGRSKGEPRPLRWDREPIWPMGFDGNGTFYYHLARDGVGQISTADIDSSKRAVTSPDKPLRGLGVEVKHVVHHAALVSRDHGA